MDRNMNRSRLLVSVLSSLMLIPASSLVAQTSEDVTHEGATNQTAKGEASSKPLPPLPIPVTSFGAANIGSKFYLYGGHTGDAHAYCREDQNDALLMLDTAAELPKWETVATNDRSQGLGMVAFNDELIILGGFTAKNKRGEKDDLHSQSTVRAFDTKTRMWRDLPSLPEPRSSLDAAIIGSTVYVVGGWNMQGEGKTDWHRSAWSIDLESPSPQWRRIADPPFTRRAVATIAHGGKLFVIGGMNENGGPTRDANLYDPATDSWSAIAPVIGDKAIAGFGVSGWSVDGKLYVTTHEGAILRWDDAASGWTKIGETIDARFFHRMLVSPAGQLVSLGGANMDAGKYTDLETITVR
jgi:N-acetylneuraminic acid mutarotase